MEKIPANQVMIQVLTPARRVVEAFASAVYFPGANGTLGVLPGHAPLMTTVGTGVLHFDHDGLTAFLSISGGLAEVRDNKVTLIVDVAEEAATIDLERAQKSLERARKRLAALSKEEGLDFDRAISAERRAIARIEALTLASSGKKS